MALITVQAEKRITGAPAQVYRAIAAVGARPRWLPPNYSDYTVERGGEGDGTVYSYRLKVGNRERPYHMAVGEPEPGSVLIEKDIGSSLVTTWTVRPDGTGSHVSVRTEWQGHGGIGGFFERLFAPTALKRVYDDELSRLDRYVTADGVPG